MLTGRGRRREDHALARPRGRVRGALPLQLRHQPGAARPRSCSRAIAEGFGLAARPPQGGGLRRARGARRPGSTRTGSSPVVVIDEAQLLPGRAAFDELRLLTNLAADDRAARRARADRPARAARAAPRAGRRGVRAADRGRPTTWAPLDADETGRYLAHRLGGGRSDGAALRRPDAVVAVHRLSGGAAAAGEPAGRERAPRGVRPRGRARYRREVVEAAASDLGAYMGTAPGAR